MTSYLNLIAVSITYINNADLEKQSVLLTPLEIKNWYFKGLRKFPQGYFASKQMNQHRKIFSSGKLFWANTVLINTRNRVSR